MCDAFMARSHSTIGRRCRGPQWSCQAVAMSHKMLIWVVITVQAGSEIRV